MAKNLREKMLLEVAKKEIFEQAKDYAFDYADKAPERNVFPADEAITNHTIQHIQNSGECWVGGANCAGQRK